MNCGKKLNETTKMAEHTNQIERTAWQLREGEQLLDIEKAWLIPADISYQVFSKNPFLLTETEAKLLTDFEEKADFGCVPAI